MSSAVGGSSGGSSSGGGGDAGGLLDGGFAKLKGQDFEYYMRSYSIMLGRDSKKSKVDLDIAVLGGGKSVSRHHARIFYDFPRRRFALDVIGKSGCIVEGVLHLPGGSPVKLDSQDLLQIGCMKFYFLLPARSIYATAAKRQLQRDPHPQPHPQPQPQPQPQPIAAPLAQPGVDEEMLEQDADDENEEAGQQSEKKSLTRLRADRGPDNLQLMQLEEKDIVSSVATVLSDLCGPGKWMPMSKFHTELFNNMATCGTTAERNDIWLLRTGRTLMPKEVRGLASLYK